MTKTLKLNWYNTVTINVVFWWQTFVNYPNSTTGTIEMWHGSRLTIKLVECL